MDQLQKLYIRILHTGLIVIRTAIEMEHNEWADVEINFLHNIPSLLNETNIHRHRYFWEQERPYYLERINELELDDDITGMRPFYDDILKEMEPHFRVLLKDDDLTGSSKES